MTNTKNDISDGERIDIPVKVTGTSNSKSPKISGRVFLEDTEGNETLLTVFENNDCAGFEWEIGEWYLLEQAEGNIYQGEKQLNPSWDLEIRELKEPPSDTDSSEDKDDLDDGDYLNQFELGTLPEVTVHEYRLNVEEGIDPTEEDVQKFTAVAASRYRNWIRTPVVTAGTMRLYSTEELPGSTGIGDHAVEPEYLGKETLEPMSERGRSKIEEMVKQDLKEAIRSSKGSEYTVNSIRSIVEEDPCIEANGSDFTASRKYKLGVEVMNDGTVTSSVHVSLRLKSTFSAAEYVERGYDIEGVSVEHDTELYDNPGTGEVVELEYETGYTDFVDTIGSSVAKYHVNSGYVEEEVADKVASDGATMAHIDYGNDGSSNLHALEYLRIVPTLEQLKSVDPDFHSRFQPRSRMDPQQRFELASSFIEDVGATPALGLRPQTQPSNAGYSEVGVDSSRNNLRFGDERTAGYGRAGLSNHGVYKTPPSFDILSLYPERYESKSQNLLKSVIGRLNDFGARPSSLEQQVYELGSEFNYSTETGNVSEYDGVLAVVPDPGWIGSKPDIDDPYPEFKRQFGQEKVPSQMVRVSNTDDDGILNNVASGLVAKCGGVPWRVDEVPGDSDVFVGLDVTYDPDTGQHLGASANIVLSDGTILASQSTSLQKGETFQVDDIVDVLKRLLRVYVDEIGKTPNHVVIHRDGRFYLDIEELEERLQRGSEIMPKFDLVEIRKSGCPRIVSHRNGGFETSQKGTGFSSEHNEHAYLATTGDPEPVPGTPRPIRVSKRRGPTDIETLTRQVYWLSEAHVGSVSRSTRLPITTYYADQCADYTQTGYMLDGELVMGVPYI